MSDDEQTSGGRMLRVGRKKDRPNWFMIAGGAVAMAVGVVFGRRRILNELEKEKEKEEKEKTSARTQAAFDEDDDTGSMRTYETVRNGTPYWDNSEAAEEYEYESPCFKTKRPAPSNPSPKVSKFCRQLSHNSVCQSNKETVYSDSHTSTAALQAGLTARREMVHRLRQQIRSRDAMIYDMQTQLSDQDQMIAMHRNHSVDLQDCVQAISTKLFEANLEIQKLHRELMALHAKPIGDLDEDRIDIAVAEIKRKWVHPKDVEEIVLEARKLNEEVERLEREKEAKESLAQAKARQCELLCTKVSNLATELKELKTVAQGKQRLLEVKEQENFELANVLQDLQHKFEKDDRGNEWASSRLSRQTDPDVDRPATPTNCEESSSKCKGAVDGNYQQTGSLRKSHGSVHARNDSQQDSEVSVAKAESTCASDAQTKRCEQPADLAVARVDDHESNEKIDRSLVLTFDHEVNQVASALSMTSKVVSEQMQAARRVLMDFQEHIGFQEHMSDAHPVRSVAQSGPQVCKGIEVSEIFSSLCEGMSAKQKQEMRDEFEQVAKQLDIEREMKVLSKHQTKLRELKSAVAKLTARFDVQNSEDDTSETEMLQLASSLSDIEQKLLAEEELAKQTFSCIQQLSTLFQLSSPQKPPVQEIWRTVTETTGNPISGNGQHKHFIRFTDAKSRNILQKLDERTSSRTLERQDSSTSASRKGFSPTRLPTKPLDNPYQFQLGASSSGPNSRPTRGRATLAAGRTSFRKPATEPKRQSAEPSEQQRVSFRVDVESNNNGFSFGLSARDRPLDAHFSQAAESGSQAAYEQGDRMSSPEPESNTHPFNNDQRFPSFSVSEPTRFRPCTTLSFNTPAYLDDRCSRFCSPQSPCFGVTTDERPFTAVASSKSDQMKRSDFSYNSNPDCSPRLRDNNASGSSVGVSRYLDVRQPGSPVDSLRNFDRDHHFEEDEEDDDGVSRVQSISYNRDLESLCQSVSNLETKDSSGSCNPDEPRLFLPSLLRRSNSMNHQQ